MSLTKQIAKHFRDVHFGGNWTSVNLRDMLADINWQQAVTRVYNFNTIATLVFHINYYTAAVLKVFEGGPLNAHDKFSFESPLIDSAEVWESLKAKALKDAEDFANFVEQLPEHTLWEDFTESKYGNYYRNIHGIIEHTHYHLGQIALIKKILLINQAAMPDPESK